MVPTHVKWRVHWLGSNLLRLGLCLAAVSSCWALDPLEEFKQSKRTLSQQLRSKETATRIEAIDRLQQFPIADSVKLVHGALSDADGAVHDAALLALIKMSRGQEASDALLTMARRAVGRKDDGESAAPLLAVLLSSSLPSTQRETAELLEKLGTSKNGMAVVLTLADELGENRKPVGVPPLLQLSKLRIFSDQFAVRRAVVHALTLIPAKEAIGALIDLMPRYEGEAQADAIEYLAPLTGQIFGMETKAWQRWWSENQESFEFPRRVVQVAYRGSTTLTSSAGEYYGLPIFAERLVFVLDTSGSMTGPRIVAAKRELIRAIAGLPEHASFSIVVFNSHVHIWQRQLVPATTAAKQQAAAYVNSQDTQSNTASYDALEAAFSFDTEAIYFLSDGAPHGGKIAAPVDIVDAITTANRTRRLSVYTIGIGAGFPGSPLDVFLKTLAEQNRGIYRRVDN